jgi:hypothetical protein
MTPAGLPHSEISGSTPACDSPKLFAANHVLHRFLTPRHSPCALSSLTTNLVVSETLKGLRTSDFRSGRQSLPSLGHWPQTKSLVHRYFLQFVSRYAVYKVETKARRTSLLALCLNSPLTLDCFVLETCDLEFSLALKTRFRVVIYYLVFRELTEIRRPSAKGEYPI